MNITYTLKGEPRPKQRPRLGRGGNVYTPQQTVDHEAQHGWMWKSVAKGKRFEHGPLVVEIDFMMGKVNPDLDNMIKLVLDGLNKIAWRDDIQVCEIRARKMVARTAAGIGTTVTVAEMEGAYADAD